MMSSRYEQWLNAKTCNYYLGAKIAGNDFTPAVI